MSPLRNSTLRSFHHCEKQSYGSTSPTIAPAGAGEGVALLMDSFTLL